jgi:hypothetical protein
MNDETTGIKTTKQRTPIINAEGGNAGILIALLRYNKEIALHNRLLSEQDSRR